MNRLTEQQACEIMKEILCSDEQSSFHLYWSERDNATFKQESEGTFSFRIKSDNIEPKRKVIEDVARNNKLHIVVNTYLFDFPKVTLKYLECGCGHLIEYVIQQ